MNVIITPTQLAGHVIPPPSKSQAHRLIIAGALARGESVMSNIAFSQDIQVTLRCMEGLGAGFTLGDSGVTIYGLAAGGALSGWGRELPSLDCGESGSTLRFLIPIALAVAGGGIFAGHGRLMERPQRPYFDLFDERGIYYEQRSGYLTVRGLLKPGTYRLPGNVSSQFLTGLLYTLPLLEGTSEIMLTSPMESAGYVDMTLEVLNQFGITVDRQDEFHFRVSGKQMFQPRNMTIEADWSQGGFWYAAKALGNLVDVGGLDASSTQGDRVIEELFTRLCCPGDEEIDVSDCPDLVPPLAAMSVLRNGITRLTHASRLRLKESDRLATVGEVLNALGAKVTEGVDSLTITGVDTLPGGVSVDSHNDHRIAMMAAIAATRCQAPITLTGAEAVNKSYPSFWEEYERLGGQIVKEE